MALNVDIRKRLGRFQLNVQFSADRERLALLGASGCGKSVTLRCIAGILTPDEGHIDLDGTVFYDSAARVNLPPRNRHTGYLFQHYALFPNMTVRQNIACAVRDAAQRSQRTQQLLERFSLTDLVDLRPAQLSGGQKQRTALVRILASDPEILLLDEPFSALDSYLCYQLELELSETLDRFSGPVLWVSHDRSEVFRNCTRVCVLDQGKSQPVQDLETLFRNPGTEAAARLSGCKNYADVVPQGRNLYLPQWHLTLDCGRAVPETVSRMGIRAHHVHIGTDGDPNSFRCRVEKVIEDVFTTIVLLRPESAPLEAPVLRMELDKADWKGQALPDRLTVRIDAENILLLREE